MKKLYMVRHAKSSWDNDSVSDFDRTLNHRGLRDAPIMGKKFKELKIIPDSILSSAAMRAKSTARILASEIGFPIEKIEERVDMYLTDPYALQRIINEQNNDCNSLMIVGHNPGMTELANMFAAGITSNLPTCSLVGMEFDVDEWDVVSPGVGTCIFYEYPKKY